MFVFEGRQAGAEFREQSEIDTVISGLTANGYKAALRAMLASACEVISVHQAALPIGLFGDRRGVYRRPETRVAPTGDLLFKDAYAYIVQPLGHRLHVWEIRHHSTPSAIGGFCELLEALARNRLDGRRLRGMNFAWHPIKERPVRRFSAQGRFYQEAKLETKPAEYSADESRAARSILNPTVRTFLLRLAQVGKARASDAANESESAPIQELLTHGLVRKEYLILCRKDSHTICTVPTPEELNVGSGSGLTCAVCGSPLKDEVIQEIYALSDTGRALLSSSRWMTIWVTEILAAAGVSKDGVAWNAVASGDELDILTDALGPRVFFELKDREFGLGDAYPFAYRVSRYGGAFGVVVTTDRVADEAKRFFEEQTRNMGAQIYTIEGAEAIEREMPALIDRFSRSGVLQLLVELAEPLALDPLPILNAWMDSVASRASTSNCALQGTQASGAALAGLRP
jgi:hypothetical protein